ncbi:uncharacterized protein BDV17DRAFT_280031 [Aspergillus undulatus]|uniref:uncharacterized protein n=1 Tax=Aspergillus undulatus TaxID=1810928 RepID=UPI003CCE31FE
MSQETPTQQPPSPSTTTSTAPNREADFQKFKTYAAYSFLVASPILIALPPRKLDHLTVLLTSAFAISANHITYERTGRSILERIESFGLPSERALEIQAKIRASREKRLAEESLEKEERERLMAQRVQDQGVLNRVWMGSEEKGWKERRLEEERKALSEGRGYGDLIKEHIWDVWTWGEKEGKDGKDRKVVSSSDGSKGRLT